MARCLVLGADGFMGSHLAEALSAGGHFVRAFDHFHHPQPKNLKLPAANIGIFRGDFQNQQQLQEALTSIEYVFHFISTTNQVNSAKDPLVDLETNVKASVELFQLCAANKVKRLIFPSSGGTIYGRSTKDSFSELDRLEPASPYAIGKVTIENFLGYFKQTADLDSLVFRISNAYGERQNLTGSQGVIPIFLNLIKQQKPLPVIGAGDMVRDYIYVKDVAKIITAIFDKPHKYPVYNLASGQPMSLNGLVKLLQKATGRPIKIRKLTTRPFDLQRVVLNTDRLVSEFKQKPATSLENGIAKTWRYVLAHEE